MTRSVDVDASQSVSVVTPDWFMKVKTKAIIKKNISRYFDFNA